MILGAQFRNIAIEHPKLSFADETTPYDRKQSVGTIEGYRKRYNPQKTLGLKHRPNQGLSPRYRDTGFHG